MANCIGDALDPGKFKIFRIGVEPTVRFKGSPLFQLVGYEPFGLRNKTQQRKVKTSVFDYIEICSCAHSRSVHLYVSDAAVGKESSDVLAEQQHCGIGKHIFTVTLYDKLAGTEYLLIALMYRSDFLPVGVEQFSIKIVHCSILTNFFFVVGDTLFVFQLPDFLDSKFTGFVSNPKKYLVFGS